jgi:NitT/TauT family transport system substrate-binding protein
VRGRAVAVALALAALVSAAFGFAPGVAAERLRVGNPEPAGFDFSPITVGAEAGIFARHGLEVESFGFAGGAKVHQAIAAGSLDMALGSGPDMAFIAKGATEKGVAAMAGPPLNMGIIVRPNGAIASIADLKGKTIGVTTVGSLTMWLATELSRREGWGADGLKPLAVGNFQANFAQLSAKNIDASVANLEGAYGLEAAGRAKVLLRFGDVVTEFLTHVIFASDAMIRDNPDGIRRFLKAWFETIAFMRAKKDEAIRLSRLSTGLTSEIAEIVYREQMPMFLLDGHFDPKAMAVVTRSFVDSGTLKEVPDTKTLFTEEFLP